MINSTDDTQLSQCQKLISISRDLASTLDLDILLNRIVQAAAELSDAEAASILLYDQQSGKLHFQVTTNLKEPLMRGLIVPVENSIAGWIVQNRQPIIINEVQQDKRHFKIINKAIIAPTQSLLGVPLIARNKITGVLEAINKKSGLFTPGDQEILMTLGAQAAVAIENSRLFQQSDLIAEFVHELRTPLSALFTATDLIMHPKVSKEKKLEFADSIYGEVHRLSDMADDFLHIARLESGRIQFRIQPFDLTDVLNECVALVHKQAEQSNLSFESSISTDIPTLHGDRDKIKQAVLNLLSNAIKYTPPGGDIILETATSPDEVKICVRDTGIGVSETHQRKLFEKFYRVPGAEKHASGTGLGLAIVKRIVEGHGGVIEIESEVDVGTTFSIHLPLGSRRR